MTHERHPYDESCPGCQLALMDPETGKKLPDDHYAMKIARPVWNAAPLEERQACNRVWVHGSRSAEDIKLMAALSARIQKAMNN